MRRNNLSRSDEDNVQIASSISRAVLINAYDTAGDRAGKGDRHAGALPTDPTRLLNTAHYKQRMFFVARVPSR
jgi:hypothetical protein